MPRSRGSDNTAPPHQRASPRAPLHLRAASNNTTTTTTSADSNGSSVLHHNGRPIRDRSPKLEEHRRSPRSPLPEVGVCTTAQKKRATRVADLETRLSHAQEELRKLREQLATAEAAKKDAQLELQETKKKKKKKKNNTAAAAATSGGATTATKDAGGFSQSCCPLDSAENADKEKKQEQQDGEDKVENQQQEEGGEQEPKVADADAEEREEEPRTPVTAEGASNNPKANSSEVVDVTIEEDAPKEEKQITDEVEQGGNGSKVDEQTNAAPEGEHEAAATPGNDDSCVPPTEQDEVVEPPSPDPPKKPAAAEEEMLELETRLWKKDKELDLLRSENASLKSQLAESAAEASELTAKVASLESSLDEQRLAAEAKLNETDAARATLEAEVRRLRVQTEQWRKAADAAAAIISGEELDGSGALGGRRVAERCGSMDKYIGGGGGGMGFDAAAVLGSPLMEAAEGDCAAAGKRRGIRVFDLWKKKGQSGGTNK